MRFPCHLLALAICCVIAAGTLFAENKPAATGKETVRFDGQTLVLASQKSDPNGNLKEYLPEAEKIDAWTRRASIEERAGDDPRAAAAEQLRAVKEKNPLASSSTIQNPRTGEVILDFVTWNAEGTTAEFNLYKYGKTPAGGLRVQRYALRETRDVTTFLKGLKPVRERLVGAMAKEGLQTSR